MRNGHLQPVDTGAQPANPGGNDGANGFDARLRHVENDMTGIRTELKHLASKAWVLGGVIGGMVLAASLTIAILKLFS